MSANTLGFLLDSFGFLLCLWLIDVVWKWRFLKTLPAALMQSRTTVAREVIAWCVFVAVLLPISIVRTIAFDHAGLRYELMQQSAALAADEQELRYTRNNLPPTDMAFINMRDLLAGFAVFRHYINGETCSIKVTAPRETEQ